MTAAIIAQLCRDGGFRMLPLPNSTGFDDGLLFSRLTSDGVDVVAAWSPNYAVSVRVPTTRDMRDPFRPSPAARRHVGTFADIVHDLVARHGRHRIPTAVEGPPEHDNADTTETEQR